MKDYGFPIGWELVQEVIRLFRTSNQNKTILLESTDFNGDELDNFIAALDGSAQNSVDAFLESREGFLEVGIAAMSAELSPNLGDGRGQAAAV
ncbi:MAG TPA: hypothetical protein VGG11_16980 [Xanthobacteraceae bacterium]